MNSPNRDLESKMAEEEGGLVRTALPRVEEESEGDGKTSDAKDKADPGSKDSNSTPKKKRPLRACAPCINGCGGGGNAKETPTPCEICLDDDCPYVRAGSSDSTASTGGVVAGSTLMIPLVNCCHRGIW